MTDRIRIDIDQADVLLAVTSRLRVELELNERNCYLVLSAADPPAHWIGNEDNWQVLVSGSAGTFDQGLFEGGGRRQVMEAWTFAVGIYTRIDLDESSHWKEAMLKANRGIYRLKKSVLHALAGVDLTIDEADEESSTEESSTDEETSDEFFLRELIRPIHASQPVYMQPVNVDGEIGGPGIVQMIIGFSLPFDWNLEE